MPMLSAIQFSAPSCGHHIGGVYLPLSMRWEAVAGNSLCVPGVASRLSGSSISQEIQESTFLVALTAFLSNSQEKKMSLSFPFLPLPAAGINLLKWSGFMSIPVVASSHLS